MISGTLQSMAVVVISVRRILNRSLALCHPLWPGYAPLPVRHRQQRPVVRNLSRETTYCLPPRIAVSTGTVTLKREKST